MVDLHLTWNIAHHIWMAGREGSGTIQRRVTGTIAVEIRTHYKKENKNTGSQSFHFSCCCLQDNCSAMQTLGHFVAYSYSRRFDRSQYSDITYGRHGIFNHMNTTVCSTACSEWYHRQFQRSALLVPCEENPKIVGCRSKSDSNDAFCQIRKIVGCACTGNAGNVFPATVG